jgi:hypothetical protein
LIELDSYCVVLTVALILIFFFFKFDTFNYFFLLYVECSFFLWCYVIRSCLLRRLLDSYTLTEFLKYFLTSCLVAKKVNERIRIQSFECISGFSENQ